MENNMTEQTTMNTEPLRKLLERVYLNGLINECLLQVDKNNNGLVAAIDEKDSVVLSVSLPLPGLVKGNYGITNLSVLIKFLKTCQDEELSYKMSADKKWLTFRRKGHGKFSILLIEEDLVSTKMEDNSDIPSEVSSYSCSLLINNRFIEDALYYMSLVEQQGVEFNVNSGKVILVSSLGGSQHFEISVGSVDKEIDDISVPIYGGQLQNVLNNIELQENSTLHLKTDYPVVISQDEKNHWALTPID